MPHETVTTGQLLLAEYQSIKDEQKARIGFRDNLLYVTLAAVAAVVVAAVPAKRPVMLLALPPVCFILGWTYLVNDEKISAIGRYVRTDLGPRIAALAATGEPVFGWEEAHRSDGRRASRKVIQCTVDLTAFCLIPVTGMVVYWVRGSSSGLLLAVSAVEAVGLLILAVQIVLYARPDTPVPSGGDAEGQRGC
ncbi:hypothetical protein [Streptomyces sp. CoT10]|uniref:hypothetical protein n=1 Tax=Streptomyces sp. CoT10 TaxID=2875762 RepID=UPI001CD6E8B1|nr:hypothetical protein [Streptomyces sp. CoT10]